MKIQYSRKVDGIIFGAELHDFTADDLTLLAYAALDQAEADCDGNRDIDKAMRLVADRLAEIEAVHRYLAITRLRKPK